MELSPQPPDMAIRPTAILTELQVIEILDMLRDHVSHTIISDRFDVSKKTISRISDGETWREVSRHYHMCNPVNHVCLPSISPDVCNLIDEITAIKNHFGFTFHQPLYWGWFEAWDGLHSVTSDGYIIWESTDLVKYAQKIAKSGIREPPVMADQAEELPTFELEDIMSLPVGEKYVVGACAGDVAQLIGQNFTVLVKQRYVNIAERMRLDIREAGSRDSIVYLTRNKPKARTDLVPIVIACAVTMKEAKT